MKKILSYITIALLVSSAICIQPAAGQEKTKEQKEQEQKEKEAKLKQAIELQKKSFSDQQKKQQEAMEEALKEVERSATWSSEDADEFYRVVRPNISGRGFRDHENNISSPPAPGNGEPSFTVYGIGSIYGRGGDSERTTWDFSKYVKESTFSKQYSFDIEKTVGSVSMTVIGDCKAGEIRVKILMPGGRTYSDIVIDEFGNLNWRKSFTISEEENKDKTGEWIFKIDAAKATGSFKISLQTY